MAERPLPETDDDSREWWAAMARHEFVLPWCTHCERYFYYPRVLCPHCHGEGVELRPASGGGVIHSYTIARRPAVPALEHRVPYVVALIDLDEGPRMLSGIVTEDVESVRIGERVSVIFEDLEEGVTLPMFARTGS